MDTLQAENTSTKDATAIHKAEVESLEQRISELTAQIETQVSLHRSTEESHTATKADLAVSGLQRSTPALLDNKFLTFDLLPNSQAVQAAAQKSAEEVLEAHKKVQDITSELEVRLFVNLSLVGQEDVLTFHLLTDISFAFAVRPCRARGTSLVDPDADRRPGGQDPTIHRGHRGHSRVWRQ